MSNLISNVSLINDEFCKVDLRTYKFIQVVRSFIGSPFRHAGRNSETGLDCVGVLIGGMNQSGLSQWDDTNYSRTVNPKRMREEIELFCLPVLIDDIALGDILYFKVFGSSQHAGVVTLFYEDQFYFTHSMERKHKGGVIEERLDERWLNRIDTIYRWKGDI